MVICSAYGCPNRSDRSRKPGISFHRYPKEAWLRERWLAVVHRSNWTPNANSALCSEHFRDEFVNRTFASGRTELKPNAIPSIFPSYPARLQKKIAKLNKLPLPSTVSPVKLRTPEPVAVVPTEINPVALAEPAHSAFDVQLVSLSDQLSPTDAAVQTDSSMSELEIQNMRLKWQLCTLKNSAIEKSATIKKLRKQNLRMCSRIFALNCLVEELQLNSLVDLSSLQPSE